MVERSRRAVLGGVTAAALAGLAPSRRADAAETRTAHRPVTVDRRDPRYRSLVNRSYNRRFAGTPDTVYLVTSTADVVAAVDAAMRKGARLAVRGGGHGFEDFVDAPSVRVVIDMARMSAVSYDRRRRAFAVEAGATLGDVYRQLYLGWGVTIPAGTNPHVGVGGHVVGAGYGALCRLHGLTVDHLYAVEVVTVDAAGRARAVVATRERTDPNRELWWAHTGGGGGSFGVVTRYWFRSPGAPGGDPSRLLPAPPSSVLKFTVEWPWREFDEATFRGLVDNYGRWAERHATPGSPAAPLYGELVLPSKPFDALQMTGQVSTDSRPRQVLDQMVSALTRDLTVEPAVTATTVPWLRSATDGLTNEPGAVYRVKIKSGYPRRRFTRQQVQALHSHLTSGMHHPGGLLSVNTYGGQVNAVDPSATAMPHRDSIFVLAYLVGWTDADDDASQLAWMRDLYRDVYSAHGGVPADDGTFINYPDADLTDPELNTSGTPWQRLYFGDSYPRLQRAKARWDPHDVFRHPLSVELP